MICELLSIQKHIVKKIINENKCFDFSYTEEELVPHNIAMVIFYCYFEEKYVPIPIFIKFVRLADT